MERVGWLDADAAARLLPKIAAGSLVKLALLMARDEPELAHANPTSPAAPALGRRTASGLVELATEQIPAIDGYAEPLLLPDPLQSTSLETILTHHEATKFEERQEELHLHYTTIMTKLDALLSGDDPRDPRLNKQPAANS